jgi:iron(III) transport system substrate-binding protein
MRTKPPALLALLAVAMSLLGACGLTSGPNATALTIYTSRPKVIAQDVLDAFEESHPEYRGRVRMLTLGAGEVVQRVRAEAHRPQADIWWGGTTQQFEQGAEADLLAPAPNDVIARVPEQYRGTNDTWLGEMRLAEVIFYNDAMLRPDQAPRDWDDLIEPRWKDKILVRDVAASGTMRSIFSALIWQTYQHTGNPDEGYAFLRALDRNTKDYTANPSDLYLRVQRQEAPLSVWGLQDVLVQRSKGAPFTPVIPASGAPVVVDGVGKIKNGPHDAAADAFLDFLLSAQTQQTLADKSFQLPTIAIPQEPQWLASLGLHEMPVDWPIVNKHEKTWIDYWVQNIKNHG